MVVALVACGGGGALTTSPAASGSSAGCRAVRAEDMTGDRTVTVSAGRDQAVEVRAGSSLAVLVATDCPGKMAFQRVLTGAEVVTPGRQLAAAVGTGYVGQAYAAASGGHAIIGVYVVAACAPGARCAAPTDPPIARVEVTVD